MIELNWSRCRLTPYAHQKAGVRELVMDTNPATGRVIPKVFALFDQVGAGKSKQIADSAQFLYDAGSIDTVVVVTPGFARSVWSDPDPVLGEVAKHAWDSGHNVVIEYSALRKQNETFTFSREGLHWIVTNYEFIRRENRLAYLMKQLRGRRVWLVLDESWSIKTYKTENAKACRQLRKLADRATILNGSPVDGSPLDLYSQMQFLDPRILAFNAQGSLIPMTWTMFKARYSIEIPVKKRNGDILKSARGRAITQVVDYQNLEELTAKVKPYILQRKTRECIDLPEHLPPIKIEAKLTDETWKIYTEMRDHMVAWLSDTAHCTARQAIVKGLRLLQITSGYLGGVEEADINPFAADDSDVTEATPFIKTGNLPIEPVREIGREKLDALLSFLNEGIGYRPDRLIVWCKFRLELERTAKALALDYDVHKLQGGQSRDERRAAKLALAPETVIDGPTAVCANTQAGGASLNFTGASVSIYLSNDFSLLRKNQSKGRLDRPGQKNRILYVDILAVGPKGQKTIDHQIIKALDGKEQISEWTTAQWRAKLLEE